MRHNLRHLRVFLAVVTHGSVTRAAGVCNLSQPAVTQAIAKLEREAGGPLFQRTTQGLYVNALGQLFARRVSRALAHLDRAATGIAPRLSLTATVPQLSALIAVRETQNHTLAARRMGVAQPTVHKAASQLERETGRPLFQRSAQGVKATREGNLLADAAGLCFAELAQAEMELAEALGREVGTIVIGALPLSRASILPRAIVRFRETRPGIRIRVADGAYAELLGGLRRGEVDVMIGALRDPAPIGDVVQTRLFDDRLTIVTRPGHPLTRAASPGVADLAAYPAVLSPPGTPARHHFDAIIGDKGVGGMVETSSFILMRELLLASDHIGCISRLQAEPEIASGALTRLPLELPGTERPIGLTTRLGWEPTPGQADLLAAIRQSA